MRFFVFFSVKKKIVESSATAPPEFPRDVPSSSPAGCRQCCRICSSKSGLGEGCLGGGMSTPIRLNGIRFFADRSTVSLFLLCAVFLGGESKEINAHPLDIRWTSAADVRKSAGHPHDSCGGNPHAFPSGHPLAALQKVLRPAASFATSPATSGLFTTNEESQSYINYTFCDFALI